MFEDATLSQDIHHKQYHLRISRAAALCSNARMENAALAAIRRRRLRQLIDERYQGVDAALATAIDRQPAYLSFIFADGPHHRNIGEKLARHIEKAVGLPERWLDDESSARQPTLAYRVSPDSAPPTDRVLLTRCISMIEEYLAARREKLPPDTKARVIEAVYDDCKTAGKQPDQKVVERYLRLVK